MKLSSLTRLSNALRVAACVVALALVSGASYAGGDAANGEQLATSEKCAGCHGADGNSSSDVPTNPKLAGQYESYLVHALKDYRSGARQSAIMAGFAAQLSDQDIADLAAWFSSQESDLYVLKKN